MMKMIYSPNPLLVAVVLTVAARPFRVCVVGLWCVEYCVASFCTVSSAERSA